MSAPAPNAVDRILSLEVPVIVLLGERRLALGDVLGLFPGSILDLGKTVDSSLSLVINNRVVGAGVAVKVNENFGLRISRIGTPEQLAAAASTPAGGAAA